MTRLLLFAALAGLVYWMFRKRVLRSPTMSSSEAAKILSVTDTASADEIIAAHKKLIGKVHPDKGGSAELAAQVNQARDVLLARLTKS